MQPSQIDPAAQVIAGSYVFLYDVNITHTKQGYVDQRIGKYKLDQCRIIIKGISRIYPAQPFLEDAGSNRTHIDNTQLCLFRIIKASAMEKRIVRMLKQQVVFDLHHVKLLTAYQFI